MAKKENTFIASLIKKDRYDYKINIPERFRVPSSLKKPKIYSFDTGSSNPSEKLINFEYLKIEGIMDENEKFHKELIIPNEVINKTKMQKGDRLEVVRIDDDKKITFFCSDTTKNENIEDIKKNISKKIKNKQLFRSQSSS